MIEKKQKKEPRMKTADSKTNVRVSSSVYLDFKALCTQRKKRTEDVVDDIIREHIKSEAKSVAKELAARYA